MDTPRGCAHGTRLAERLGAPVWVSAYGARRGFPTAHPAFRGMPLADAYRWRPSWPGMTWFWRWDVRCSRSIRTTQLPCARVDVKHGVQHSPKLNNSVSANAYGRTVQG